MLTLPRELEECPFRHKAEHYWVQLEGLPEQARLAFVRRVCAPPFRSEIDASPGWRVLTKHIEATTIPVACCLELEHAFRRAGRVRSLTRGLQALADEFPSMLQSWLRWVPYRLCRTALVLGSLSEGRIEHCLQQARAHPLFRLQQPVSWDNRDLAESLLETWAPLPPPAKVVDCLDRELSPEQQANLQQSLERWLQMVRLDLVHHYCRRE